MEIAHKMQTAYYISVPLIIPNKIDFPDDVSEKANRVIKTKRLALLFWFYLHQLEYSPTYISIFTCVILYIFIL